MSSSGRLVLALPVIALVGMVGCAAKLTIASLEPGALHLGKGRELVIVWGEGSRPAHEAVLEALVEQTRLRGYFRVIDLGRGAEPIEVKDGRIDVESYNHALGEGEIGLEIDVLAGKRGLVDVRAAQHVTRLALRVTAFDRHGRVLLAEAGFSGAPDRVDPSMSNEQLLRTVVATAVKRLLESITPVEVMREVPLDVGDSVQQEILEAAIEGNIAFAREEMKAYLENDPRNAAAIYNLAVLTEAMGRSAAAIQLYDRALSLDKKPLYHETRAACVRHAELEPQDQASGQ